MSLNKKSIDDINVKGKRVLVRCDFNVPLKDGKITDENRINGALPTIQKLIKDGGKVILCSHLGKVKNGPNEGESLAPVAAALEAKLGQKVTFVADYNVTGEAATKAVSEMKEGDVVLLQNTRFRGKEETKPQEAGDAFAKELADLADVYVCDAFGSAHRAHASVAGVTKFITAKGGENVVGYLMQKEIDFLGKAVENPVRPFVAILGGAKVADKLNVIDNLLEKVVDNIELVSYFSSTKNSYERTYRILYCLAKEVNFLLHKVSNNILSTLSCDELCNTCYRSMCSMSRTESVTYIYISKVSKLFCECISGFLWLCLLFASETCILKKNYISLFHL